MKRSLDLILIIKEINLEIFVQYVVPILELIMSVIGIIFLFKPSTPSISVDVGDKYYFTQNIKQTSNFNTNSTNQSDYGPVMMTALMFFGVYLFYSLAGKLMIFIIMIISLIKIIRYKYLGISYRVEIIPSIMSILVFYTLNWLPNTVKEFWETNTKVDFSKFNGLHSTIESILAPFPEFLKLVMNFENNRIRNISIFAILFMTFFVLFFEGTSVLRKKEDLKILSRGFVVFYCIVLLISLGYAFYHIEQNPVRIVTEIVIKYLNN